MTMLAHLVIMICYQIISLRSVILFRTTMSDILSGLVNNQEFYKMSIIDIYSRRFTFSTLTVTNNLPTFKAHLTQVTRAYSLQSILFLKVELLF